MLYCEKCGGLVPGGLNEFQEHLKKNHKAPFICQNGSCQSDEKVYSVKSSFVRHLATHHQDLCVAAGHSIEDHNDDENLDLNVVGTPPTLCADVNFEEDDEDEIVNEDNEDGNQNYDIGDGDFHTKLETSAAVFVLQLWRHGNVPGTAILHVVTETKKLMNSIVSATKDSIVANLRRLNVTEEIINESVENIYCYDPFRKLKSTEMQMNTFEEIFDLVKPQPKPLGRRIDERMDRTSRMLLPVDISVNFQYVSLIQTLTVILNNPVLFKLIHEEKPSSDGNIRSYLDGSACSEHPLISKFPHTLRLVKWMDDSEVVNAQGAKTSIHKIVSDCFTVQNLPAEENSRLRSIHLSSYSYREDHPEGRGTDAVLEPFFAELEQLESEEGVPITVKSQPFTLRATLIAFSGDALAAHELLGLYSTSCNRFCSQCLVHKQELYQNIMAMGVERSKAMHQKNLEELSSKGDKVALLSSGVKRLSTLVEKSTHAAFPEAMIKDPMHDFLRGIAPMEIKLALHHYVVVKKYFQIEDFNASLKSFAYGPADMKNKPSPNFTLDSLKKPVSYVLHQSASQTWCLLRVFPFIVTALGVPSDDSHLNLLVLLKRMCDIIFSTVVSNNDLDLLEKLTKEHHLVFFSLYPPPVAVPGVPDQQDEDSDDDLNEDFLQEEQVDDPDAATIPDAPVVANPAKKQKKKAKVVRPLFKHHFALHYRKLIQRFGAIILYWCMRYEAKNALLKRYGAICNNFQNLPVTFAQVHQIAHAAEIREIKTPVKNELKFSRGKPCVASTVPDFLALSEIGVMEDDVLQQVKFASLGGFKFSVGLFVALPIMLDNLPTFGKIRSVYVKDESVFVVTEDVKTVCYEEKFGAFLIDETAIDKTVRAFLPLSLPPVRPLSAWIANNLPYLSPKNLIADLYVNNAPDD